MNLNAYFTGTGS